MLDVLRFWLDLGLDGFRLDAVPYLFEREGTNCENLPETHAYLKRVRARDRRATTRTACCWPRPTSGRPTCVQYFGDGDECHMAFHFPVMPRMFMAIRREEADPIYEILEQTPADPGDLPVGPVPAQPRRADARDGHRRGARLHVRGVRQGPADEAQPRHPPAARAAARQRPRRDRAADTRSCSRCPARPVLYYGDEIAMGDNVFLGDRDGVRTPMQWTGDRNGGFSRADFAQLYAPPLMDPVYGYPGRQRRGAAAHGDLAAALDAPLHRAAQGAPRVRVRHLRADRAVQPADLRPPAPVRG